MYRVSYTLSEGDRLDIEASSLEELESAVAHAENNAQIGAQLGRAGAALRKEYALQDTYAIGNKLGGRADEPVKATGSEQPAQATEPATAPTPPVTPYGPAVPWSGEFQGHTKAWVDPRPQAALVGADGQPLPITANPADPALQAGTARFWQWVD